MSDFFDDLERQLVAATPHRPQRLRRARARHAATLAAVLVTLLAGGAGLTTALSNGGDGAPGVGAPAATTPRTERTTPAARTTPSQSRPFTVAVLNATAVPGLARGVANRLQNAHFKIGNVTNAARQDQATTMVHFAPGRQWAATQVAAAIGLKDVVLRPITPGERVVAGEQATVVVVVGSDQNTARAP
jgi:hypothetical protein